MQQVCRVLIRSGFKTPSNVRYSANICGGLPRELKYASARMCGGLRFQSAGRLAECLKLKRSDAKSRQIAGLSNMI
jgi:hypothetical protein